MTAHPSDYAELAIDAACAIKPPQLKQSAMVALRAYALQHEALLSEAAREIRGLMECGCDGCIEQAADALETHARIFGDLQQLVTAYDLIAQVSAKFPMPSAEAMAAAADYHREQLIRSCAGEPTTKTRAALERLVSHPTESNPDA